MHFRWSTTAAAALIAACQVGCPAAGGPEAKPGTSGAPPPPTPAPVASAPAAATSVPAAAPPGERSWTFDQETAGGPPAGFSFSRTGSGAAGKWVVRADPSAPSKSNVLVQEDADATSFRFPVAVAAEPVLKDLRVSVRCKPISGRVDQACGLVFRYADENNYYVTRANPLEGNVRLYYVKDGKRQQIATWDGKIEAGSWHEYAVEVRGDAIDVRWSGAKIISHRDATFTGAGKVGLWTKADSVTSFDDLTVTPL